MAGACTIGGNIEPVPIRGPAPTVVAVWPFGQEHDSVLVGLAPALARRGYGSLPPDLVREILQAAEPPVDRSNPASVGRALRADAVLELRVVSLEIDEQDVLLRARWSLQWRLLSTRGAGEQWRFDHSGVWLRPEGEPFDPTRRVEPREDARDVVPIGGYHGPVFRSSRELVTWLHRHAMEHLPTTTGQQ